MLDYEAMLKGAFALAVSNGLTFFFSRRKQNADVRAAEIANELKSYDVWKSLCSDLKGEIEELRHEVRTLQKKARENDHILIELQHENDSLRLKISDLQQQNYNRNPL